MIHMDSWNPILDVDHRVALVVVAAVQTASV